MENNLHWLSKGIIQQLGLNSEDKVNKIVENVIMKRQELYSKSEGLGNVVYNLDEASSAGLIGYLYEDFMNIAEMEFDAHLGSNGAIRLAALLISYDYLLVKDVDEESTFKVIYGCMMDLFNGATFEDVSERLYPMFKESKYVTEFEWNKLLVDLHDLRVGITNDQIINVFEFSKPNKEDDKVRYQEFLDKNLG